MILKVIGTGSKGNCYLLEAANETLMIECGVNIQKIKQTLNFNFSKLAGCLVTHEHQDHAAGIDGMIRHGVNIYATAGTLQDRKSNRAKSIEKHKTYRIGGFKVKAYDVPHDAVDPVGFLIEHPESGKILFLTDAMYCPYTFNDLNNIIIEANYSKEIIDRKVREGANPQFLRNRILKSHMSLENCIASVLLANDLSQVNNIVLIHLSNSNSDEALFKKRVHEATGKTVTVADNGLEMNFNKYPF